MVQEFIVDPGTSRFEAGGSFTGLLPTFGKAGFKEAARRSKRRAVLRLRVAKNGKAGPRPAV
jgi:hypothetical protein